MHSTLWHSVFPDRGSLFEDTPRRVVAHTANPTLGAELPGPVIGGPRLDTVEAILAAELEAGLLPFAPFLQTCVARHSTHTARSTARQLAAPQQQPRLSCLYAAEYRKNHETVNFSPKRRSTLF